MCKKTDKVGHFVLVMLRNSKTNYSKLKPLSTLMDVDYEMFCHLILSFVSFVALIALERPLLCVRHHVPLQCVSKSAFAVALVTLEWFFS